MRKKQIALLGCCVTAAILLLGCQSANGTREKAETEKVTETISETEMETETDTDKETEKESLLTGKNVTSGKETSSGNVPAGSGAPGNVQTGSKIEQTQPAAENSTVENTLQVSPENAIIPEYDESGAMQQYEGEAQKCPYCGYWFSAETDGTSASPYELHVAEERANDPAGGQTEQEMVQCPDCGNWYESGNIFRNHICTGR